MVNDLGVPLQVGPVVLVNVGVTLMVLDTGAVPLFTPLNALIFPVPLTADNPMAVLLLVQLYAVPVTVDANVILPVDVLLHTMILLG